MTDREFLERMDRHLSVSNRHMAVNKDLMAEIKDLMEQIREEHRRACTEGLLRVLDEFRRGDGPSPAGA